jgi:hypothetical protein
MPAIPGLTSPAGYGLVAMPEIPPPQPYIVVRFPSCPGDVEHLFAPHVLHLGSVFHGYARPSIPRPMAALQLEGHPLLQHHHEPVFGGEEEVSRTVNKQKFHHS